ncbi:TIGR02444 family protein [Halomonas urumqiensis]|uniref:TIGR02444 family protein n=1 Tax=Halomonas urumqiensis TaxID=1684789 RepID=A0A2N7UNX3_9GAMM|nr:TIGR02444 family protein [Halomonas urumqiensis]PMR82128.1 TIGR02444 family protein [Halomonas urumqiensis]PTB02541.1 TIGR02444 family protein [Halomonas urumqiensis]GHE21016.1 hypothetical protein GCM10017767_15370 [Halomonas urumqiensis]
MDTDSTELPSVLRARLTQNPLWDFAVAFYGQPDIEAACLTLQDEAGVDVCELLWHCWLMWHGLTLTTSTEALSSIGTWQREVTVPLRQLRRQLKAQANTNDRVAKLRETLKQAELQAERETLARLENLALQSDLRVLSCEAQGAGKHLAQMLQLQKKSHLSTLQTLIARLDPPTSPR